MSDETAYTDAELAAEADLDRERLLIASTPIVTDPWAPEPDPKAPEFLSSHSDGMGGFSDKLVAELQAEVRAWTRQVVSDHYLVWMLNDPDFNKGKHVYRWVLMHMAAAQNPAIIRIPDAFRLVRKQLAYNPVNIIEHVINLGKISSRLLTGYCWVDEEVTGDWRLRPSRVITAQLEDSRDMTYDSLGFVP